MPFPVPTPAQIMAALTKDAVRIALFDHRNAVGQRDIDRAFLQQWMGIENPIEEMAPEQRRQIAVHEAGHTVAVHYLLPEQRIAHVTIIARADALGFMLPLDEVEVYAEPLQRIVRGIMVGMAGHIATRVVFGEAWTGASDDNQKARNEIRRLYSYGYFGPPLGELGGEESLKHEGRTIERFWRDLDGRVEWLLRTHREELVRLADSLLERGDLSREQVLAILGPNKPGAPASTVPPEAGTPGSTEGSPADPGPPPSGGTPG